MWITELATKTITAERRIGSHNAANPTMTPSSKRETCGSRASRCASHGPYATSDRSSSWSTQNPRWGVPSRLLEEEVGHRGFEIPIDQREGGQVEGGVCGHRRPEAAGERVRRAEYQPGDRGLLDAGEPLLGIMRQPESGGGDEHRHRPGPRGGSQQLAEPLEQITSEHGLFSEAAPDHHGVHRARECGAVSGEVMECGEREEAERPEAAQLRSDAIARRRSAPRLDRSHGRPA